MSAFAEYRLGALSASRKTRLSNPARNAATTSAGAPSIAVIAEYKEGELSD
jgi:hypothetical protein